MIREKTVREAVDGTLDLDIELTLEEVEEVLKRKGLKSNKLAILECLVLAAKEGPVHGSNELIVRAMKWAGPQGIKRDQIRLALNSSLNKFLLEAAGGIQF
jgi:hypothetical protein